MTGRRRPHPQDDLFSVDPSAHTMQALEAAKWPPHEQFPFNREGARVRSVVRADLVRSPHPLVVAGYSSIAELVDLLAEWAARDHPEGGVRVLLGAEPFGTERSRFTTSTTAFTDEVRRYWEARGVSLRLSAKVLQAIDAVRSARLQCCYIHGAATLHAKVYVGADAATVGSSNFTAAGLGHQLEANARFERSAEPHRYEGLATIAENLWAQGQPWDDELLELLDALLQAVPWHEALARACATLLEGEWARRYLDEAAEVRAALWPSQRTGIAQALWIIETVGSVLVADATGSGKTRMGAHLVRAVRDRLWSTGRARRDLAVVVCPPAVERTWRREANVSGVNLQTVSHGLLSRGSTDDEESVNRAEILAVDESHNFLNPDSRRTRQVRDSRADHVVLFTATPINRGPTDLLQLVGFLGADNFEDETLEILRRLERRRDLSLSAGEVQRLRAEIGRFTVRRTKALLNELVDREPEAYRHPDTGRVCRYPRHDARTYPTGETSDDERIATHVRSLCASLAGVAQLERRIAVPAALRAEYSDERWLHFRLTSVRGLAAHHVLGAMRSSTAALVEHLLGTAAAEERFALDPFKAADTGDVIGKVERLGADGPPELELDSAAPSWLVDADEWAAVCAAEQARYAVMARVAGELSDARERTKAALLADLAERHERVLAFDHHPVTLEVLRRLLDGSGVDVLVATGTASTERRRVEDVFARTSTRRAIALCSDAMNEGLNLQGASAVVHLDLPTTLRVAEQRIGRIDRMDSPHDRIEAHWPHDGPEFATRANELLAQRAAESRELLGANLEVPAFVDGAAERPQVVDVDERIQEAERPGAETWDGIRDAFEPVRSLVSGAAPLVDPVVYERQRHAGEGRVISMVASAEPWAFLAVRAGSGQGAPRWLLLEGRALAPVVGLDRIADRLRVRLAGDPPAVRLEQAVDVLDAVLARAAAEEGRLLPRRMRLAVEQMARVTGGYAVAARRDGDEATGARWAAVAELAGARRDGVRPDPYAVAEAWLHLVRPRFEALRSRQRSQPFVLLRHVEPDLRDRPLVLEEVERALGALPQMAPIDERVTACILGVPGMPETSSATEGGRGSR